MDGSFITYQPGISPDQMEEKVLMIVEKVRKYQGEFVFLWHNSSFNTPQWIDYHLIPENVIKA